jgi:hypothetical protein
LVRQHWQIENQVHRVRDVTFDENGPKYAVAAFRRGWRFRKTVIGEALDRETNSAAACRHFQRSRGGRSLCSIRPDN